MSIESRIPPFMYAEKFSFKNLVGALLDSPILRTRIHIGKVALDGKTVQTRSGDLSPNHIDASPGEKVVTHEVI